VGRILGLLLIAYAAWWKRSIYVLEAELSALSTQLLEYNDDFETLQKLEGSDGAFSAAELAELKPLLGLYCAPPLSLSLPTMNMACHLSQKQSLPRPD
jgi:hypothetical protein